MRHVELTPFGVLYMGLIPDEWCKVLTPFGVNRLTPFLLIFNACTE